MMKFRNLLFYFFVLFELRTSTAFNHTWNFASVMPDHFMVMFSMSWFGIPSSDPQGAGPDSGYGNWEWAGGCISLNHPDQCNTNATTSKQRWTASKRRPLAGIYSSSATDAEGKARVNLMLSTLRRPCDSGAKIDAWAVQLDSLRDSALYPSNIQCASCNLAYHAYLGFLNQSQQAGMTNAVMAGLDSTWYFHFGNGTGLGLCNGKNGNPQSNCVTALQNDIVDMIKIANKYTSSVRINGHPVVLIYVDAAILTAAQWVTILDNARNTLGFDFYAIATTENAGYFSAFDAIAPWLNLGQWNTSTGGNLFNRSYNWVKSEHASLYSAVAGYSGRTVFGGITPGFDDYTMNWGGCTSREISRDPQVLEAQFAYLTTMKIKGAILQTWDDWTEGSEFEPDVVEGPSKLLLARQLIGTLFNEPADPTGDNALVARWNNYGQLRNCSGAAVGKPTQIDLTCPSAPSTTHSVTSHSATTHSVTTHAATNAASPVSTGDQEPITSAAYPASTGVQGSTTSAPQSSTSGKQTVSTGVQGSASTGVNNVLFAQSSSYFLVPNLLFVLGFVLIFC